MKKFNFKIGNKIFGGFMALIIIFIINAGVSIFTINKSNEVISETEEVIEPSTNAIEDFILMATQSKMLITNWVYLQSNQEDKEALKELHNLRYPDLKDHLQSLMQEWDDSTQVNKMDSIFQDFEAILDIEKNIMGELVTFEDYEDPMIKLMAEEEIESEILPRTKELIADLEEINNIKLEESDKATASILANSENLQQTILVLGIIIAGLGLLLAFILTRNITKPINHVRDIIVKLGKGELPEEDKQLKQFERDEVGEMAIAVDKLVTGLKATSHFAENIGNGDYNAEFTPLSENDVLGNSLLEMRDNLKQVAEEDKKRNWATEGSAKFGEILRQNNNDLSNLSENIISNLVKYLEANQGGIYIIRDENEEEEPYMTLEACYAWNKKKYIEQKIYKGEGLTGQAWLEKDTIYLTDVPDDYISITSGLGEANPTSILIVPLKVNDEVQGVIELASFYEFSDFEKEFVEKIAESIASTISSVKINAKTQKLLEESTQMTEQMQAQEEEMRQNMEELQATQEEMSRNQQNIEDREARITAALDNSLSSFISVSQEGKIDFFSNNALDLFKYSKEDLEGMELNRLFKELKAKDLENFLNQNKETVVNLTAVNKYGNTNQTEVKISTFNLRENTYYILRITELSAYEEKANGQIEKG